MKEYSVFVNYSSEGISARTWLICEGESEKDVLNKLKNGDNSCIIETMEEDIDYINYASEHCGLEIEES